MAHTNRNTKQGVKYVYAEQYKWTAPINLLYICVYGSLYDLLYKGIGMLKLGRVHRQTGEKFVDPTAMSRQMREVSDF